MPQFLCSACGYGSASWYGKCPSCSQWNTFFEQKNESREEIKKAEFIPLAKISSLKKERGKTGIFEFDRVLGGGLVRGSVVLLSGEPGVGKSTLLLTSLQNLKTLYISGEEAAEQVKDRAERLNINLANFYFSSEIQIEGILNSLKEKIREIDTLIIDSIQTVYSKDIPSPVGSISQLKEVALKLIDFIKQHNLSLILVGHITKEGDIAGPKTLEHLVDCVLYFEGERSSHFRILRCLKNRFGPTDEVGIFEMGEKGLKGVNSSTVFLEDDKNNISGKAIVGVLEGTRPLFFEVQSLVVESFLSMPRRVSSGIDYNKLLLLLAVVRKNLNLSLDRFDIYVNVVGGVSLKSTACDLGVIASIVSSIKNVILPEKSIFIGEVGLLGEIRKAPHEAKIIKEAKRFGFLNIYSAEKIKSVKELKKFF